MFNPGENAVGDASVENPFLRSLRFSAARRERRHEDIRAFAAFGCKTQRRAPEVAVVIARGNIAGSIRVQGGENVDVDIDWKIPEEVGAFVRYEGAAETFPGREPGSVDTAECGDMDRPLSRAGNMSGYVTARG